MASATSSASVARQPSSRRGFRRMPSRVCTGRVRRTRSAICGSRSTCRPAADSNVICRAMRRGRRVAAVAVAAACAFPGASADASADAVSVDGLDAGAVRVEVAADPFRLAFVDAADGDRLETLAGADAASPDDPRARYGSLGYAMDRRQPVVNNAYLGYYAAAEANTLWFHATKLASSSTDAAGLHLVADTNDPVGDKLEVQIRRVADGVASVETKVSGPLAGMATTSG